MVGHLVLENGDTHLGMFLLLYQTTTLASSLSTITTTTISLLPHYSWTF